MDGRSSPKTCRLRRQQPAKTRAQAARSGRPHSLLSAALCSGCTPELFAPWPLSRSPTHHDETSSPFLPRSLKIRGLAAFRAAGSCACIRSRGLTGSTSSPPPAPLIPSQAPSHQNRLRRIPGHAVKSPRVIAYATSRPFSARPIQPRRVPSRRRQRRTRRPLRLRPVDDAGPCPCSGHPATGGSRGYDQLQSGATLMGLGGNWWDSRPNPTAAILPCRHPGKDTSLPPSAGCDPPCLGPPPPR